MLCPRSPYLKQVVVATGILHVGFAAVVASCSHSQPLTGADELRELHAFLAVAYPGPKPPQAIGPAVEAAALALEDQGAPQKVAAAMHLTLALYGDAHLVAGLPSSVNETTVSLAPVLPVRAGDRVFVDASSPAFPVGTELISFEGRPIEDLLGEDLARYPAVDGGTLSVRAALAERDFTRLAYLHFGMKNDSAVTIRRPGEAPETIQLPGLDREGVRVLQTSRSSIARYGPRPGGPIAWPFMVAVDETTRLLRLSDFGVADRQEYERRIDDLFSNLNGDETLILDVRGNNGGYRTHGVAVLRHLLSKPFTQWRSVSTRIRSLPSAFKDRVRFLFDQDVDQDRAFDNLHWREADNGWIYEGDPLAEAMTPRQSVHRGPVVVFVDEATNSAAVEMVVALRAHRPDVVVLGVETRGGCARHTGELPVVFETPESRVPVLVSLFDIELVPYEGCAKGRGVMPDSIVTYDDEAFFNQVDPYLEAWAEARRDRF